MSDTKHVVIHTDGSCLGNPGRGGYGAILIFKGQEKELSGGFRDTTSSRMELMAVIAALQTLTEPCHVTLYSDSQYVVNSMSQGWAEKWRKNEWMRNKKDKAENIDLWDTLLQLSDRNQVESKWEAGHAGNPYNERCDQLAREAADKPNLPADFGYEARKKSRTEPPVRATLPNDGENTTSPRSSQVRKGLGSPDPKRRKDAIFRVVEEEITELVADLLLMMEADAERDLRGLCAWAIGKMGYREASPNLVNGLENRSQVVRKWSAWALGELGDSRSKEPLRRAIAREELNDVKQAIRGALKKLEFESTRVHRNQLAKALRPPLTRDPTLILMIERLEQLEWPSESQQIVELRADMKHHDLCYFELYIKWIEGKPAIIAAFEDESKVFG